MDKGNDEMNIKDKHKEAPIEQEIRGKMLIFRPDTHTYIYDGVTIPSVTQLISKILPSTYKNVDPFVLQQAAEKGISLHKEIELYETKQIIGTSQEFKNYLKLKTLYDFEVVDNELMILVEHEGQPICAGRLDMIINSKQEIGMGIADIKRTYQLNLDYLNLQLNLYKIGYEQTYNQTIDYLRCIHLRYQHHAYVNVSIDKTLIDRLVFSQV